MNIGSKMNKNNISYRAIIYMICQVLVQGIGLFMAPVYTRLLTPHDYGIASVFVTTVSFVSIFIGLQTNGSFNNFNIEFATSERNAYKSSMLWLSFCSTLIIEVVFIIFGNTLAHLLNLSPAIIMLIPLVGFGCFCIRFLGSFYTANMQSTAFLAQSVCVALGIAVLSVVFIWIMPQYPYLGKITGYSSVYLISGIVIFIVTLVKGKTFFHARYWKFCLPLTLPLVLHAISGQILSQSDRIMLNSMQGSSEAGIYSLVYSLSLPLDAVWMAFNSAWVPQYYEHMKNGEQQCMHSQMKNYRNIYTGITMGFILVGAELVKIIAPPAYENGIPIVPLVALSCYFTFLYSFPANYEFYHKKTKYISVASTVSAATNIVLNLLLIPRYGMMGAASATLISYILIFLIHEYVARFIIKQYNMKTSFYIKGMLPVLITFGASYLFMDYWILRWISATIIGVFLLAKIIKNKGVF